MNYIGNRTITLSKSNEDVIYEAVTDTNDPSYLDNLDQVYDVVGEEDWIHGEVNCLANLASSWTITLSWEAKKKESTKQRSIISDEGLQVGNHVVVKNHHGKQWPHKAQIIVIDMENNTALISWETTQNIDLVDLEDLKQFHWRMHHQESKNPKIFIILLQEKNCIDWAMTKWEIWFGTSYRKYILLWEKLF
jgi:hypothetical protein